MASVYGVRIFECFKGEVLRHFIRSSHKQPVASEYAGQSQDGSLEYAVFQDCLLKVRRAGGRVDAVSSKSGGNVFFVKTYRKKIYSLYKTCLHELKINA